MTKNLVGLLLTRSACVIRLVDVVEIAGSGGSSSLMGDLLGCCGRKFQEFLKLTKIHPNTQYREL